MKKIIVALLLLPLLSMAQTAPEVESKDGMKFEHGSWTEILAKRRKRTNYIIVDCFTTWCGPCKYMDSKIFPTKEAGDFFNANYLNVKIQFDSTANDNAEVKSWRKDMKAIEKEYAINAYPTYLIFDPNGVAVHRAVGSTQDAKEFVARGKEGMAPETQYYTQLRRYEGGKKDTGFLHKMALMAQSAYDSKSADKISSEYIATMSDVYTKENLEFITRFTSKTTDKGFAVMLENPEKVDAVIGGRIKTIDRIKSIVYTEEANALLKKDAPPADFVALKAKLTTKYPTFGEEYLSRIKVVYYQRKNDWNHFQSEVVAFMDKYGAKATEMELNNYAWTVFENCKDMTCVAQALDWSKRSFKDKENPMFMDTYANILHKLGKTKEAIEVETKALALVTTEEEKKSYQETLDKMKKGEKTWTDK